MKQISMKLQLILSCIAIIFTLLYKGIFYEELRDIKNIYFFVFYLILVVWVIITSFVSRKHEKKPFILALAYVLALILVLFL